MKNELKAKLDKKDNSVKKRRISTEVPLYDTAGIVKQKKQHKIPVPAHLGKHLIIIACILAVLYVPGIFIKNKTVNNFVISPDVSGISAVVQATKSNPEEDFDNDGITNSLELKYGTSVRRADTDGDGVCDYAELFITDSDPLKADDSLYKAVMAKQKAGTAADSPYKLLNIVFWPDTMKARVYGSVVRTLRGYRFCNYKGWVEFPTGKYAYKIVNGRHILLEHKAAENAWYIDDESEIVLTNKPLEAVHKFSIAGHTVSYIPDNAAGKFLTAVLPEKGILTCEKMMKADTWDSTAENVTAKKVKIKYKKSDTSRYQLNMTSLKDIAEVYKQIKNGDSVLVSLNSSEYGEVIGEVYGYTPAGDLLIADPQTLEPAGTLQIIVRSGRYMNQKGKITRRTWYEFKGLGYDSAASGDRINFFAASVTKEADSDEETSTGIQETITVASDTTTTTAAADTATDTTAASAVTDAAAVSAPV